MELHNSFWTTASQLDPDDVTFKHEYGYNEEDNIVLTDGKYLFATVTDVDCLLNCDYDTLIEFLGTKPKFHPGQLNLFEELIELIYPTFEADQQQAQALTLDVICSVAFSYYGNIDKLLNNHNDELLCILDNQESNVTSFSAKSKPRNASFTAMANVITQGEKSLCVVLDSIEEHYVAVLLEDISVQGNYGEPEISCAFETVKVPKKNVVLLSKGIENP